MERAEPLNPQRVFWELSQRLPDNCILTGDAGTATNWYGRIIKMRRGMMGSLSGSLATMGSAVPYAIAAKFAYPDRTVIALTGDGAMQMNGMNEMLTVEKYWKHWGNPRLIFLVLNNRDLNQVTWEMRIEAGNPKLESTQNLPDFPYARYAELLGLRCIRVDRLDVSAYTIPTDAPESDGTYAWDKTTMVLVEASAGGRIGIGYTYADTATATLIRNMLAEVVRGRNAMNIPGCWLAMVESIRNLGRPGIASMAISAVDFAPCDLNPPFLHVP